MSCIRKVERDSDGAVVRTHDIRADEGALEVRDEVWRDPHVVDAPANVASPAFAPGFPVGVRISSIGVHGTEAIDIAGGGEAFQPGTFLGEKAGAFDSLSRAGDIDVQPCDVEVAHEDDLATSSAKGIHPHEKGFEECLFEGQAFALFSAVGEVSGDDGEVAEVGFDDAALGVEFGDTKARPERSRCVLEKKEGAAIAGALCGVPEVLVTEFTPGGRVHLLRGSLDLLHAHDIGLVPFEPGTEVSGAEGGAKAVDVPGANGGFHIPSTEVISDEKAGDDHGGGGGNGNDSVFGSGVPLKVVVEDVVDEPGSEVETNDEQRSAEQGIERKEVEDEAKFSDGEADSDCEQDRAFAEEAVFAQELESQHSRDEHDGCCTKQDVDFGAHKHRIEGKGGQICGHGKAEAQGTVATGCKVNGLVFSMSDEADCERRRDGGQGAGIAVQRFVDEKAGPEHCEGRETEVKERGPGPAIVPGGMAANDAVGPKSSNRGSEP